MTNLACALVDQAAARPELRLGTVDDQVSLADAVELAAARAAGLLAGGLKTGDRVALVAPTSTDYLVSWLACLLAGTPVALVNPSYPSDLLEQMLAPVAPALVLDGDGVGVARQLGRRDVAGMPGLGAGSFDIASFMHTSGTTGLPKFCAQSHDYFFRLAAAMSGALGLRSADRVLAPLPMFHINPMGYGLITAILTGADALTVDKFSASSFWPAVVEQKVTVLVLHAPPVEILKRATSREDASGHQVRTMFYADGEFLRQFRVPAAVSGYGSTEAGGISHLKRWSITDDIPANASRHGGPGRSDIEWRIDDTGVIQVRQREHAALFDGYVTSDGINSARDRAGWFDTGDLGRAQDEDYLIFLERGAESIRVKGEFIPIPFVENHLGGLAGLDDLALWKRPGTLVDDDVVLYAVADPLPLDLLSARIAELPAFMRPVVVARIASVPRDAAAGKVQRRLLTDQAVLEWVELT